MITELKGDFIVKTLDREFLIGKCPFAFYEKVSILGEWKTFEEFDREAQIEEVPIKEVLKKSFIYDAM